ncbi:hypothetical protein Nepgr_027823 [Nepenthes gracilis]|uniref:Uncharacterized protein n=1 Tax=Nepenthes gracilis TaxID=150966 RepID=A0AAD3Y3C0_NEPGR|nr:hypothetical protein Nepgr_027823 [Nepenthes gracilis]
MDLRTDSPGYENSTCETDERGGYSCRCKALFFKGNPYLPHGCQVVQDCEDCIQGCVVLGIDSYRCPIVDPTCQTSRAPSLGIGFVIAAIYILLLLFGFCIYKMMKKRRENRIKAKFFKQNGGLLLKQQMSSS